MSKVTAEEYRQLLAKQASPERKAKKHLTVKAWLRRYRSTVPRTPETKKQAEKQRALFDLHDTVAYRLWLPLSPSNNALKQICQLPGRRPFMAPTAQATAYAKAVEEFWAAHWNGRPPEPLTGRLRVLIIVHPHQNGIDVANREKALCDALTKCGCWLDDGQIDHCAQIRGPVIRPTGALDVIIETIT